MLQCRLTGPPLARLSCRTGAQPAMQPATAIRHGWALARPARPCSRAAFGDRREVETGIAVFEPSAPLVMGCRFAYILFVGLVVFDDECRRDAFVAEFDRDQVNFVLIESKEYSQRRSAGIYRGLCDPQCCSRYPGIPLRIVTQGLVERC